jgi:nucleotide-binding universal stress UspA family protein
LYADLLVLGQHHPSIAPGTAPPAGFVESALIDTGKALIVPHTGSFQAIGHEVLIGWNATPQAAHAVAAALPWLRGARHVHVLESAQASSRRGSSDELDIAQYLHGHAVSATLHGDGRAEADAGDALLSLASDVGADLLVMGCYGHSRARELMLGGATRIVLQTMTLPVLMAH